MSRVYFHSIDGDTEVSGSERARLGRFCSQVTWTIIKPIADEFYGRSILRNIFPPDHYALKSGKDFSDLASLYFRVAEGPVFIERKKIDLFNLNLNTALRLGSDPVRLGARLHGQCEIHAYVNGCDRRWLAGIIAEGRMSRFFRDDAGWESVIELLLRDDTSPVVTSYSVCESFPNATIAGFDPPIVVGEPDWDTWYELSGQEQWDMGMIGLRESDTIKKLEMKPENWDGYYFGDGMDAMQFVDELLKLYPHQKG